jgi:hypothetical protein
VFFFLLLLLLLLLVQGLKIFKYRIYPTYLGLPFFLLLSGWEKFIF